MSKNQNNSQIEESALSALESAGDNDEIVDLLQVVKPGKNTGPQPAQTQEVDFSADLEAMLNSLSEAEKMAEGGAEAVLPFPDPTPVDHEVDHDESLDLPSMDEIDKLLEDLGGEDIAELNQTDDQTLGAAHGNLPNTPVIDDIDELDAIPADGGENSKEPAPVKKVEIDDDFLHSLPKDLEKPLSLKSHVEMAKAREEKTAGPSTVAPVSAPIQAVPPLPEPALEDDPLGLVDFGEAADIDDSLLEVAETGAVSVPEPQKKEKDTAPEKATPMRDEVDLNELDALVDNVLASAPVSSPAPSLAPGLVDQEIAKLRTEIDKAASDLRDSFEIMRKGLENEAFSALARATSAESSVESLKTHFNEQAASIARQADSIAETAKTVQEQAKNIDNIKTDLDKNAGALKKDQESLAAVGKRLDDTEKNLSGHKTRVEDLEKSITGQLKTLEENLAAFASLPDRMEGVEQSMAEQVNRLKQSEKGLAACEAMLGQTSANVADYAKAIEEAVQNLSVLTDRVSDLETRFTALESHMEKTAAAAAAKVIREEITALLKGGL